MGINRRGATLARRCKGRDATHLAFLRALRQAPVASLSAAIRRAPVSLSKTSTNPGGGPKRSKLNDIKYLVDI